VGRIAKRKDKNQKEIQEALEKLGYACLDTSSLGHGRPDLVVMMNHRGWWFEVKMPGEPLTPAEVKYHATHQRIYIVHSVEEAKGIVQNV
jgi:hypothetical protein